ncbi:MULTISPECIES: SDR family NAD(P)-dependent oxidoreductase [Clostridium]|uniref:SDR family NAD(P)-dependent oxidoreductase n=1 Tax=Clostridium TaxID=1485 RepID=UPI0008254CE6|nr:MULTISPECIES: SDR family oxidoreductase [Clostridium]
MSTKHMVLITGASTGIGREMAKIFAQNGFSIVIAARNRSKLIELSDEIKKKYTVEVLVMPKDLSIKNSAKELFDEIREKNIEIDTLVNNAGMGDCGFFHESSVDKDTEMIELNITSLTILTRIFSEDMVRHGSGKILNVASTGAYMPGPFIAVYYATKAYVLSFTEAIANELKEFNIQVSALCPGATITEFAKRAGKLELKGAMSAESVARIGFTEFMKGKQVIIPGFFNKVGLLFSKFLPRRILAYVIGKTQRKLHIG